MTGFKVGDKGQRYEVRYKDNEGTERILGWAEISDEVDNLKKCIELHPSFYSPRVIDRRRKRRRKNRCKGCGFPIADEADLCGECACEDDCRPD